MLGLDSGRILQLFLQPIVFAEQPDSVPPQSAPHDGRRPVQFPRRRRSFSCWLIIASYLAACSGLSICRIRPRVSW